MKFQYAYRDSKNDRHEGVVLASSKDDAFKKLRSQGVKPFFVAPAPGFLNRVQGLGKRGLAIFILVGLCLVLGVIAYRSSRLQQETPQSEFELAIRSKMRRQPIGDVAIIEKGIRTGWTEVFELEGERFLASFAVPGVPAGLRNTTEEEINAALSHVVEVKPEDGIETRQSKAMVEGMKDELRRFMSAGGSIAAYGRRLVRRQEEEIGYYQRAQRFVEQEISRGKSESEIAATIDRYNQHLRNMGIRPITMPEERTK